MTGDLDIWYTLMSVPGLGCSRLKVLCEKIRPISLITGLSQKEIASVPGIGDVLGGNIFSRMRGLTGPPDLAKDLKFATISDPSYPKNLFNIYDPPTVLYYRGAILKEDESAVAVVGTRNPSAYGIRAAEHITRELVRAGFTIVSGLAAGIDSCAHETALRCGGRTIAVLASGPDDIYPRFNRRLSQDVASRGAVVSEVPRAPARFEKWAFPRRNRIISGLSLGTVVVEGAKDSGSLITAAAALDQNREVFAVPGDMFSRHSAGPNSLIKSGAKLVQSVEDILEELPSGAIARQDVRGCSVPDGDQRKVFSVLATGPKCADLISEGSGIPVQKLFPVLLSMQMNGYIRELPGRVFSL